MRKKRQGGEWTGEVATAKNENNRWHFLWTRYILSAGPFVCCNYMKLSTYVANYCHYYRFQDSFVTHCVKYIEFCLRKTKWMPGHLLILGSKSAGKTVVTKLIAQKLLHSSMMVYTSYQNCAMFKGQRSIVKMSFLLYENFQTLLFICKIVSR